MTSEDRAEVSRMIDAAMARLMQRMTRPASYVEAKIAKAVAESAPHIVAAAQLVGDRPPEIYIPTLGDVTLPRSDD